MIKKISTPHILDNKEIAVFELKNKNGAFAQISNYGGTVMKLCVPNKEGKQVDVVLGFDDIEDYYTKDNPYMGAFVGRYANRIANAKFSLNGTKYQLSINENKNQLHGGNKGFDKMVMDYEIIEPNTVKFSLISKDMEEGFPGELNVSVMYTFNDDNELLIEYNATSNKDTIINLTNHSYFNLDGEGDILNHTLQIFANGFTAINEESIPTGKISDVENTPFDFTIPREIGECINDYCPQLKITGGYDHNFVLDNNKDDLCAKVWSEKSGISMNVYTNKPGVQLYTSNTTNTEGKGIYKKYSGLCLETQFFPNTPNIKHFPSCILRKDDTYSYYTKYSFLLR